MTFLPHNLNELGLVFSTGCPKTSASQSLSVLGLEWNFFSPLSHREQLLGTLGQSLCPSLQIGCCGYESKSLKIGIGTGPASSVLRHSHLSHGQCCAVPKLISLSAYGVLSFCLSWLSGLSACLVVLLHVLLSFS